MSIYKACDIRGIFGRDLDEHTAYLIGRAVGSIMNGQTLAVGGDVRISTPVLKSELIRGILESGTCVADLGLIPTPALYFALHHLDVAGGITVTASHNPPQYNGFKLMLGSMPVDSAYIQMLAKKVDEQVFIDGQGHLTYENILIPYEQHMLDLHARGKGKVVIDSGNGSMSLLAPSVFRKLGYDVVPLYCDFDGSFPNRDPNPAVYEHLTDLCRAVIDNRADFGIAFDGDGDRVVFVDDKGNVAKTEQSFVLFINYYLKDKPSSVVYDLKSSSIIKNTVLDMGGTPIMERSGHAFIKKRFLENGSVLGGEISGHFFFKELGYDDGLHAALIMARIIQESGVSLSELVSRIPKSLITPDIRVFCPYTEQDHWLDQVRKQGMKPGRSVQLTEIDGVRLEFTDGWLLVRKSVTEESITIRIEADSESSMRRIKKDLQQILPQVRGLEEL